MNELLSPIETKYNIHKFEARAKKRKIRTNNNLRGIDQSREIQGNEGQVGCHEAAAYYRGQQLS